MLRYRYLYEIKFILIYKIKNIFLLIIYHLPNINSLHYK